MYFFFQDPGSLNLESLAVIMAQLLSLSMGIAMMTLTNASAQELSA